MPAEFLERGPMEFVARGVAVEFGQPPFAAVLGTRTVRDDLDDGDVAPFTTDDEPFDEEFGPPYFALYGVEDDDLLEHIADRDAYSEALSLAQKLAPGVALPLKPICFA